MKHRLSFWLAATSVALSTLLGACADKPKEANQGELAARAAKLYYDSLIAGRHANFYDGKLKADTVPESYRWQMIELLRQHTDNEQERHKGIKSVSISGCHYSPKTQTANVMLTLAYGDSTSEQIAVPMVRRNNVWYMR